jgi:hypothetical protein
MGSVMAAMEKMDFYTESKNKAKRVIFVFLALFLIGASLFLFKLTFHSSWGTNHRDVIYTEQANSFMLIVEHWHRIGIPYNWLDDELQAIQQLIAGNPVEPRVNNFILHELTN